MAWATNDTDNSTVASCLPCPLAISRSHAAVLLSVSLLVLAMKGFTLSLRDFSPITEKTNLLVYNILFSNTLITSSNLLIMLGFLLFGKTSQYMWSFLLCLTAFGHPLFHCMVCLERYLAVQYPTLFVRYRPVRYRVNALVPAWLSVLVVFSVHAAVCGTKREHVSGFLYLQSTLFLVILVINSLCCLFILRVLARPSPGDGGEKRGSNGRGEKQGGKRRHQIKKEVCKTVSLIQIFVIICYFPPLVLMLSPYVLVQGHFCGVYMYNITFILFSSSFVCLYYLQKLGKP